LANTFMVKVLAQLLDTVEEMHAKVEQMYEFLSSDEEETNTTKEDTVVAEEAPLAKPSAKTKQAPKVPEENTTELES